MPKVLKLREISVKMSLFPLDFWILMVCVFYLLSTNLKLSR